MIVDNKLSKVRGKNRCPSLFLLNFGVKLINSFARLALINLGMIETFNYVNDVRVAVTEFYI